MLPPSAGVKGARRGPTAPTYHQCNTRGAQTQGFFAKCRSHHVPPPPTIPKGGVCTRGWTWKRVREMMLVTIYNKIYYIYNNIICI